MTITAYDRIKRRNDFQDNGKLLDYVVIFKLNNDGEITHHELDAETIEQAEYISKGCEALNPLSVEIFKVRHNGSLETLNGEIRRQYGN